MLLDLDIWIKAGVLPTRVSFSLSQIMKYFPLQLLPWLNKWEIWCFNWKKKKKKEENKYFLAHTQTISLCIWKLFMHKKVWAISHQSLLFTKHQQQVLNQSPCTAWSLLSMLWCYLYFNLILHLWTCIITWRSLQALASTCKDQTSEKALLWPSVTVLDSWLSGSSSKDDPSVTWEVLPRFFQHNTFIMFTSLPSLSSLLSAEQESVTVSFSTRVVGNIMMCATAQYCECILAKKRNILCCWHSMESGQERKIKPCLRASFLTQRA